MKHEPSKIGNNFLSMLLLVPLTSNNCVDFINRQSCLVARLYMSTYNHTSKPVIGCGHKAVWCACRHIVFNDSLKSCDMFKMNWTHWGNTENGPMCGERSFIGVRLTQFHSFTENLEPEGFVGQIRLWCCRRFVARFVAAQPGSFHLEISHWSSGLQLCIIALCPGHGVLNQLLAKAS